MPIVTWENLSAKQAADAEIRQSVVIHILEQDYTYYVQANMATTPADSVGSSLVFSTGKIG
ncbi:hypothetical protein D3P96_01430 [Weissella viridescens]|uniref:Uncharacterized protein n=1 Tax=Weissella viridescens TaxID=1629 RepID=A0A3P2RDI3_WEIVI|nr:hypothetical protein [Weissella viridescens]RRG18674.1 hypothetical protein D3P96_01430 [Weissella viridescens]